MYNTTVTLKKGEGRTLKAGGMWVFDNEIASILGTFENGDIVNIHDFDGYFMGYGYINTNSKITLRLLARRKDTVIDEAFFEQRVRGLELPQGDHRYLQLPSDLRRGGFPAGYCH